MTFKMKGSQLYGKLKLNRNMDDSSQPDGRAKSSTFQMDKKSPIEKGETSTVDKIKSAGKAVFSNLGKVNSVSDPLSDKIKRSYKKNKKQYREEAAKGKSSPATKVKETEAEFLARMKKEGGTMVEDVDVKPKTTNRDTLAKEIGKGKSSFGGIKPGKEQSVKSSNYKQADEALAKKGDKDAAKRLKNRAKQTEVVKKAYVKNPGMTQAEIDKMMSQR
tara:strand:+ start:625 stop:1278 length:654 start_codon:yes stop_codon:yes gene_type:complete